MAYLLDTGILLRVADRQDAQLDVVSHAVRLLISLQEELVITTQNVDEFCNVATRPVGNNGLGLSPAASIKLLQDDIEPICAILSETDELYDELKRLVLTYSVIGKQVHDARLVAMMITWQIKNVFTLNDRDFRRYEPEGITIVTPASIPAAGP